MTSEVLRYDQQQHESPQRYCYSVLRRAFAQLFYTFTNQLLPARSNGSKARLSLVDASSAAPLLVNDVTSERKTRYLPEDPCAIDDKGVLYRQRRVLGYALVDICNATKQIHVITCWRNNYVKCYTIFVDPSAVTAWPLQSGHCCCTCSIILQNNHVNCAAVISISDKEKLC